MVLALLAAAAVLVLTAGFFVPGIQTEVLSALISLLALVVSLLSAFKESLFPFQPRALMDEVVLVVPDNWDKVPVLVVPLTFLNDGEGSGVLRDLTLKIIGPNHTTVYDPIVEIDYAKLISDTRKLHASCMLAAFNSFQVGPRAALKRVYLFSQEHGSPKYPYTDWSPGMHLFQLYATRAGNSKPPLLLGTMSHEISSELLAEYRAGQNSSLRESRRLDV